MLLIPHGELAAAVFRAKPGMRQGAAAHKTAYNAFLSACACRWTNLARLRTKRRRRLKELQNGAFTAFARRSVRELRLAP